MDKIFIEVINGRTVLNIEGRLDASTVGSVHDKLMDTIESDAKDILINLSKVNYVSSAGLKTLIYASKSMKKTGGELSLCSLHDNVQKVFEISGLTNLFPIYESIDEGVSQSKK